MSDPRNYRLLVDEEGKPIPQYFVPGQGFKPLAGATADGPEYIIKHSALPDGAATEAKQTSIESKIDTIDSVLDSIAAEDFATESTLDEIRNFIYSLLQQAATEDKQDALAALVGALTATAETDPAQSASLIALLKGILKQLQGDGTKPNVTQLSGSNMELYGATINDRPDADTVAAGTTFTIVDENLDQNWISDGTNWKEV